MKTSSRHLGFTLIELLVVIAILGILAAISLPTLKNMRGGDTILATTRQLQDDVLRARQYAISQRTTVYMVFCPSNFWLDAKYGPVNASTVEKPKAEKLYGKQLNSYNFVTLRSVGEQPGQSSPRYLSSWKTLPEGAIIASWKFNPRDTVPERYVTNIVSYTPLVKESLPVYGFRYLNNVPFPSVDAPPVVVGGSNTWVSLPYIAFNYQGQLESGEDEYIPVAKGTVSYGRDANRVATQSPPSVSITPPGNDTNAFVLVHIDWLTGRARVEKQGFVP